MAAGMEAFATSGSGWAEARSVVGPARPGVRDTAARTQRLALRALAPILYTARLLGVAPCRLVLSGAHAEVSVVPSPYWTAYSAVLTVGAVILMCYSIYQWLESLCHRRDDGTMEMLLAVLFAWFFLKQVVATTLYVCTVVKGAEFANAFERLVRIAGHAVVGQGSRGSDSSRLSPRWHRARLLVAAQAAILLAYWGITLFLLIYLDYHLAYVDVLTLPPVLFVASLFTDAVLLLHTELVMLNDSLTAALEPRPAGPAVVDISWVGATSKDHVKDVVTRARALQRELRRSTAQLDDAFGLQNLLFVALTFVQSTVVLYMTLVDGSIIELWLASSVLHLLQLYAHLTACQLVKDESMRTAGVVHRALLRPDLSDAANTELVDFSVQLVNGEMTFSAWGFFSLDYCLLQSFVGTVATYIVIMVQFRGPGPAPGTLHANASTAGSSSSTTTTSPTG